MESEAICLALYLGNFTNWLAKSNLTFKSFYKGKAVTVNAEERVSLKTLLTSEATNPGLVAQYQREMQHRTNEALNGLSNRMDQSREDSKEASAAQEKQTRATNKLTARLVLCTVIYTVITGIQAYLAYEANSRASNHVEGKFFSINEGECVVSAAGGKKEKLQITGGGQIVIPKGGLLSSECLIKIE